MEVIPILESLFMEARRNKTVFSVHHVFVKLIFMFLGKLVL